MVAVCTVADHHNIAVCTGAKQPIQLCNDTDHPNIQLHMQLCNSDLYRPSKYGCVSVQRTPMSSYCFCSCIAIIYQTLSLFSGGSIPSCVPRHSCVRVQSNRNTCSCVLIQLCTGTDHDICIYICEPHNSDISLHKYIPPQYRCVSVQRTPMSF